MQPPDSARFARRVSRRSTGTQLASSSVPQGWPVWRQVSLFSSFPPSSSSWRIFSCYQPFLMTSFSFLMLSSSSFSCRLFSPFSSPCSISLKVVEQTKPGVPPGLSNRRRLRAVGMLNAVRLDVMIKNIRVEAYASLPRDGGGLRVDAHFL